MRLALGVHSGNLPFLGGISALGARYGHLSGPEEIGSLGSGNAPILVEFHPPCEFQPEESSPMKIDTCHNFGIGVIGVQKNTKIHVFDENGEVVFPRELSPPREMGRFSS